MESRCHRAVAGLLITSCLLTLALASNKKAKDGVGRGASAGSDEIYEWRMEATAHVASLLIRNMYCTMKPGQACDLPPGARLGPLKDWAAKNDGWERLLSSLSLYEVARRLWQQHDYERSLAAVEQSLALKMSPFVDMQLSERWQQGLVMPNVMKRSKLELADALILKANCMYELGVRDRSVDYLFQAMDAVYLAAALMHGSNELVPEVLSHLDALYRHLSDAMADVLNGFNNAKLIETLGHFGLECAGCDHRVMFLSELLFRLSLPLVFQESVSRMRLSACDVGRLVAAGVRFNHSAYNRQGHESRNQFMARVFIQLVGAVHLRFLHGLDMACQYVKDSGVCVYYLPHWVHTDSAFLRGASRGMGDRGVNVPRGAQLLLSELEHLSLWGATGDSPQRQTPVPPSAEQPRCDATDNAGGFNSVAVPGEKTTACSGSSSSSSGRSSRHGSSQVATGDPAAASLPLASDGGRPRMPPLVSLVSKHSSHGLAPDVQRLMVALDELVGPSRQLLSSFPASGALSKGQWRLEGGRRLPLAPSLLLPPPPVLRRPAAPPPVGGWWGDAGGPGCSTQAGGPCRHEASELRRKITLCISAPVEMAGDADHCAHLTRLGVREVPKAPAPPPLRTGDASFATQQLPMWGLPPFYPPAPAPDKCCPVFRQQYIASSSSRAVNSGSIAGGLGGGTLDVADLFFDMDAAAAGFLSDASAVLAGLGPGLSHLDADGSRGGGLADSGGLTWADGARHLSDLHLQEQLNWQAASEAGGAGGTHLRDGPLVIVAIACAGIGALVSVAGGFKQRRRLVRSAGSSVCRSLQGVLRSSGTGAGGGSTTSSPVSQHSLQQDVQRRRAQASTALRDAVLAGSTAVRLEAALATAEALQVEASLLQRARSLLAQRRREERVAGGVGRGDKQAAGKVLPRDPGRGAASAAKASGTSPAAAISSGSGPRPGRPARSAAAARSDRDSLLSDERRSSAGGLSSVSSGMGAALGGGHELDAQPSPTALPGAAADPGSADREEPRGWIRALISGWLSHRRPPLLPPSAADAHSMAAPPQLRRVVQRLFPSRINGPSLPPTRSASCSSVGDLPGDGGTSDSVSACQPDSTSPGGGQCCGGGHAGSDDVDASAVVTANVWLRHSDSSTAAADGCLADTSEQPPPYLRSGGGGTGGTAGSMGGSGRLDGETSVELSYTVDSGAPSGEFGTGMDLWLMHEEMEMRSGRESVADDEERGWQTSGKRRGKGSSGQKDKSARGAAGATAATAPATFEQYGKHPAAPPPQPPASSSWLAQWFASHDQDKSHLAATAPLSTPPAAVPAAAAIPTAEPRRRNGRGSASSKAQGKGRAGAAAVPAAAVPRAPAIRKLSTDLADSGTYCSTLLGGAAGRRWGGGASHGGGASVGGSQRVSDSSSSSAPTLVAHGSAPLAQPGPAITAKVLLAGQASASPAPAPTPMRHTASLPRMPPADAGAHSLTSTTRLGAGALGHLIHRRGLAAAQSPAAAPATSLPATPPAVSAKPKSGLIVSQLNPAATPFPAPAGCVPHTALPAAQPPSLNSALGVSFVRTSAPTPSSRTRQLQQQQALLPPSASPTSSLASLGSTLSSTLPYSTLFSGGASLWSPFGAGGHASSSAPDTTWQSLGQEPLAGWTGSSTATADWRVNSPVAEWHSSAAALAAAALTKDLSLPPGFQSGSLDELMGTSPNYQHLGEVDWAQQILRNVVD